MTDQRADEGLARVLSGISHIPCGVCRSCVGIREDAACYQGMPDYAALATAARRYLLGRLPGREELARWLAERIYVCRWEHVPDQDNFRADADAILELLKERLG